MLYFLSKDCRLSNDGTVLISILDRADTVGFLPQRADYHLKQVCLYKVYMLRKLYCIVSHKVTQINWDFSKKAKNVF